MKTFGLEYQSVVESLLVHVGFFFRSFGIVFYSLAELKFRIFTIDTRVWRELPEGTTNSIWIDSIIWIR